VSPPQPDSESDTEEEEEEEPEEEEEEEEEVKEEEYDDEDSEEEEEKRKEEREPEAEAPEGTSDNCDKKPEEGEVEAVTSEVESFFCLQTNFTSSLTGSAKGFADPVSVGPKIRHLRLDCIRFRIRSKNCNLLKKKYAFILS
jgi:hypothetical protein